MNRRTAFERPLIASEIKIGTVAWIRKKPKTIGNLISKVNVVGLIPPDMAKVVGRYGRKHFRQIVLLEDLRPSSPQNEVKGT